MRIFRELWDKLYSPQKRKTIDSIISYTDQLGGELRYAIEKLGRFTANYSVGFYEAGPLAASEQHLKKVAEYSQNIANCSAGSKRRLFKYCNTASLKWVEELNELASAMRKAMLINTESEDFPIDTVKAVYSRALKLKPEIKTLVERLS
jgi:NTP pyrophosphatase (non-canonical NTP hydrolase)